MVAYDFPFDVGHCGALPVDRLPIPVVFQVHRSLRSLRSLEELVPWEFFTDDVVVSVD